MNSKSPEPLSQNDFAHYVNSLNLLPTQAKATPSTLQYFILATESFLFNIPSARNRIQSREYRIPSLSNRMISSMRRMTSLLSRIRARSTQATKAIKAKLDEAYNFTKDSIGALKLPFKTVNPTAYGHYQKAREIIHTAGGHSKGTTPNDKTPNWSEVLKGNQSKTRIR